jgi:RNA polymerase sigma-70 factor (ECF subfamily)
MAFPMHDELPRDAEDRELLSRIAEKDEDAFHRFYRRYSSLVYTLSRRITGQDHDADDVVAEVFWELWQKSDRYCPSKSSPYTYLVILTRCRALDRKRGLSRRQTHPILEWASDGQSYAGTADESPEDPPIAAEQRDVVAQAISELEAGQREAIELTFFDGLTHKAAAEKLGIPLGTVKGRIRAAVDRLRYRLSSCKHD